MDSCQRNIACNAPATPTHNVARVNGYKYRCALSIDHDTQIHIDVNTMRAIVALCEHSPINTRTLDVYSYRDLYRALHVLFETGHDLSKLCTDGWMGNPIRPHMLHTEYMYGITKLGAEFANFSDYITAVPRPFTAPELRPLIRDGAGDGAGDGTDYASVDVSVADD